MRSTFGGRVKRLQVLERTAGIRQAFETLMKRMPMCAPSGPVGRGAQSASDLATAA
jgi:hypothetical protein